MELDEGIFESREFHRDSVNVKTVYEDDPIMIETF